LARVVALGAARVSRTETLVCVAGEYKQGKSSLVNALLGEDVCPVDDDFATRVLTAIRYSDNRFVRVHGSGGSKTPEDLAVERLAEVALEGGRGGGTTVDGVEVGIDNPIPQAGLTLVDTPGVGGFRGSYRDLVRAFFPTVNAVVFVADASAEISPAAVEFLRDALADCPTVLLALTKIDLYPEWRRIADLDREALRDAGLEVLVYPVSSALRIKAIGASDGTLDAESGYPAFLESIAARVVAPARSLAIARAVREVSAVLSQIGDGATSEIRALESPAQHAELVQEVQSAETRLRDLRTATGRWGQILADGFSDLRSSVDFKLRADMRLVVEDAEKEIQHRDPASSWDEFSDGIRTHASTAIRNALSGIDVGSDNVGRRIFALISSEAAPFQGGSEKRSADLETFGRRLSRPETRASGRLDWGIGALRGAQGGGYLVAWVGSIAGLSVSAPLAMIAGAAFAAKFVYDERTKAVERRRQEARTAVRQFVDAINVECSARLAQMLVTLNRTLRDEFQARLEQEMQTTAELARSLRQSLEASTQEREAKLRILRTRAQRVAALDASLRQMSAV